MPDAKSPPLPEASFDPAMPGAALEAVLRGMGEVAVAVSGGVDSLTLATLAHRLDPARASMFHAVSPAVPPEATARVRALAEAEGWRLVQVDAGELAREEYRANPVDRCFFCKSSLYSAIRPLTAAQVVSGANLDDLAEYRPGLLAAREHGVRHPLVEAGVGKAGVRSLARELGLGEIAELPASPCLSSRVETGLRIEPATLARVHAAERLLARRLGPRTVRCRVRAAGLEVELDEPTLARLGAAERADLAGAVGAIFAGALPVRFAPYRAGSAFLLDAPRARL